MTCFPKDGVEYCKAITIDKKKRHQDLYKQEDREGKFSEKKKVSTQSFTLGPKIQFNCLRKTATHLSLSTYSENH